MKDRRDFVKQVIGGATVAAAYGILPSSRALGANDRVRIGVIGVGDRGTQILKAALQCQNAQVVALSDVYTKRLEAAKQLVPEARTYADFRQLLDQKDVDAVLIATPQHQHALNFVPAIQAGKDVYQEKTMAFNPDHARRMRKAFEGSNRIVQIGVQSTSGPAIGPVSDFLKQNRMGAITAIHTHMFRNAPYGGWKRAIPADCDLSNVNWKAFQGEAQEHAWDPNRYINWRFYWDYAGGNVFENMVHQVGFWYKALGLQIPRAVTMAGNNYLCPEMQLPDTMDVSMDHHEKILFTWNSMFANKHYGETQDELLGTHGTVSRDQYDGTTFTPEGKGEQQSMQLTASDKAADRSSTVAHMQNFVDCVRGRKEPNCPFEIGYRSAIACQMAITSYRLGRTVKWDASTEEIFDS